MTLALTNYSEDTAPGTGKIVIPPYPTYAHLEPDVPHERVARAFAAELASLTEKAGAQVTSYAIGEAVGRGIWRKAEWETGHLGCWCARLDHVHCPASGSPALPSALQARLKDEWRARGYQYVFTRIDSADQRSLHALEEAGFITVDNISLLARRAEKHGKLPASAAPVSPATDQDLVDLTVIAREAFRADRFHNDPLISDETADAMYADWIRNQVVHGLAEEVLAARIDGKPVAFVSMVTDRSARDHLGAGVGTIVLLAVDSSVRGQGLGKTMTLAALEWFSRHEINFVQVGTQAWNMPALRTYLAAGFKPARSYTTLRLHLA